MFSGSNPGADLYWANALAQAQSKNNSLDWALLAQQWISHQQNISSNYESPKQSSNFVSSIEHVPAPKYIKNNEEQGEADMDVEDDQFEPENQNFAVPPPPQPWTMSPAAPIHITMMTQQLPTAPISGASWNMWNSPAILNTNLPPPSLQISDVNDINTTTTVIDKNMKPTMIPSLMDTPVNAPVDVQFATLDAAKRKTLPAWIREGLEKMEREKQKQLEKEKTNDYGNNKHINVENENLIESLKNSDKSSMIGSNRSNLNSSNYKGFLNSVENSEESDASASESDIEKSNFKKSSSKINPWHGKTREEIEEEMMLVVRRSLTEILLEITNEEIRKIAQETFKRHKLKASSAQVISKSALSSISGNLGLGAYDSDSNNETDTDDENTNIDNNGNDSEDEIRERMLSRQRSFKVIAREIEALVEQEEARQEELRLDRLRREQLEQSSERLLSHGRDNDKNSDFMTKTGTSGNVSGNSVGVDESSGQIRRTNYERDFGETHHDKKSYSSNGQKRIKERTSRFSDNKESRTKISSSSSSPAGYVLPTSSTMLLNATASTNTKLSKQLHSTSKPLSSTTSFLNNSAATQNFLMANAILSEALLKNDKKKSSKNYKADKHRKSRSRSRSNDSSSTNSNNSDNKSSRSSKTSSSSNSSIASERSKNKKTKKTKLSEHQNENDKKSEKTRYISNNRRVDDDRLDSSEYNHSRSHSHYHNHYSKSSRRRSQSSDDDRSVRDDEISSSHTYHDNKKKRKSNDRDKDYYKDRDDELRRRKRRYEDSPDSDDYYRSRRHHKNSTSSRSSSHKEKKEYYSKSSSSSSRRRTYSRKENSRSRSRSKSKSHTSRDKNYEKY